MRIKLSAMLLPLFCLSASAVAEAPASKFGMKEVKAFMEEAEKYVQKNGKEKALAEFQNLKGSFVRYDKELYVFCYDNKGVNLALPTKPEMKGKDLSSLPQMKSFLAAAGADGKGRGEVEWKFHNPTTNKTQDKRGLIIGFDDWFCGSGYYL